MSEGGDRRLVMGPFNRVEGDLEVKLAIEEGRVARAEVISTLFRGFERMLVGRHPSDALTIVPRICGICSVSQSVAAARALADAAGTVMAPNGERALNLIHASENAADHLTHFNLFFMPDLTNPAYAGREWHAAACRRFEAGRGEAQRAALDARAKLLHIMGILAGHWPHTLAIQPGGVTKAPDSTERVRLIGIVAGFRRYLEGALFGGPLEGFLALEHGAALERWCAGAPESDLALFHTAARDAGFERLGHARDPLLSAGAYPVEDRTAFAGGLAWHGQVQPFEPGAITEDASHAWMRKTPPRAPFEGETVPDTTFAPPGYTFCKAPRLGGLPAEVGALARQVVDGQRLVHALHAESGANVFTRVIARLTELARIVPVMEEILAGMVVREPFMAGHETPREGRGIGFCEAARGTLGHWLTIRDGRIANYQIIAPTTWNFSPRDESGLAGPLERALEGTEIPAGQANPVVVQHIVRSYDPCMVCTVH